MARPIFAPSQPRPETIAIDTAGAINESKGVPNTGSHCRRLVLRTIQAPTTIPPSNPAPQITGRINGRRSEPRLLFVLTISQISASDSGHFYGTKSGAGYFSPHRNTSLRSGR